MLTEQKKQILRSYAENSMNVQAVARELHYHPHTIDYHMAHIRKLTGLNPVNFYDLARLLEIIEAES